MSRLVILTRRARPSLASAVGAAMEVVSLALFVAMVAAWASVGG